jgi:hypothetical protein
MKTITELIGTCQDEDIYVVGMGTSLRGFDFKRLNNQIVITLNNACFHITPMYLLFNDIDIWTRYVNMALPPSTKVVCRKKPAFWLKGAAHCSFKDQIYTYHQRGPDVDPGNDELWCASTVATAGLQLAWKLGASRIILLGVDCYIYPGAQYFTDLPSQESRRSEQREIAWALELQHLARWWEFNALGPPGGVINCSMSSLLEDFPKQPIDELLPLEGQEEEKE